MNPVLFNLPFNLLTVCFLTLMGLGLAARVWLAQRHVRHIARHRQAVPAAFAAQIPLVAHQKAADYSSLRTRFGLVALVVDASLLLCLTLGGVLQSLFNWTTSLADGLAAGMLLVGSVLLVSALVDLPLSLWRQFVIEERFGFNRMTWRLYLTDLVKSGLLAIVIGAPVLAAILWLMTHMGTLWWLWAWLSWCAFNIVLLLVFPTWIAPWFNRFTPLADGELKTRIEALLARCRFPAGGLFVMDGSRRSAHGNAYFTGFGQSRRIVFFDTLLERLQPAEVEAVLAHELGHFAHRHIIKRIVLSFVLSLLALAALGLLLDAPWFYTGLGITTVADANTAPEARAALGLVLFFLVAPVFSFPLTPITSQLSRRDEFEADRYAAQHASAADLCRALVKLYADNASTLTPDPLHSLFYDSHPPAAIRIAQLLPPHSAKASLP